MKYIYCFRFVGLIALIFLAACSRDVDSINMNEVGEANKATVRAMFAAIDAQDFDQLHQILAEDFELHYVGEAEPIDRETTFDLIRGFYTAFPDYIHVIEEMVAEGDQVAVKLNYRATHQAEFEGIPPTGNPISYAGAQLVTMTNGLVTEVWALEDILGLMSQLGMRLTVGETEQLSLTAGEYQLATENLDQRFIEGMSRKDVEQVMSCFWNSPDLVLVTFDGSVYRGYDNVRKAVEKLFAQAESLSLVINEVSHIPQGESILAVGTATYEMTTIDGIHQTVRERWTDIRRKEDGRWVYVLDHAHALQPNQE